MNESIRLREIVPIVFGDAKLLKLNRFVTYNVGRYIVMLYLVVEGTYFGVRCKNTVRTI